MASSQIILLLLIGYLIFTLDKKQSYLPVPVLLVVLGLGLSFIPYFSSVDVTAKMIYHVFLPAILFTSAYNFSSDNFKKNAGIITFLATVGIMATVAILGSVIFAVSGPFVSLSFIGALAIASILTPTDPVSVVSILEESAGSKKISAVVEGESLINDGTSIVIFSFLAGMLTQNQSFTVSNFVTNFLVVSIGGAALGLAFGWLMSKAVHFTHHREYQVMLSIIIAYGSFNLAEAIGVSGVLATVSAGIMLSFEYGRTVKEDHFKDTLDGFWGIAELSLLSLLFLLIGIEAAKFLQFNAWGFAFIIFALSLAVRFSIIMGTTQFFKEWRQHISWRESALISWSGLKGSMSVYLILELQAKSSGNSDMIISLAFSAVLISLVVQSLGVSPLSKWLAK
ncbi:sodium/proton antiporter, CPA1 family [Lentibacillus persicus]|uniref:Sodium/proton antiporter, CPA1 family n=1 Tax=Lentibacillus persicus TaxID=640948 RepID=A0A1I1X9J5_9BACI|nr:sodium:proton antiporter [Lentibacillus persicus]SFE02403.1 sodium/proton antiporter, CPA1 family [Lentibacillus persicus]